MWVPPSAAADVYTRRWTATVRLRIRATPMRAVFHVELMLILAFQASQTF